MRALSWSSSSSSLIVQPISPRRRLESAKQQQQYYRRDVVVNMAHTAHKDQDQVQERFEPPEAVDRKAQQLADWIRRSKHFIAFTGAGVSTSAGIPDFRGPEGVWTLRAQGKERTSKTTSTLQAIPTPTHMALVELQNRGLLKYLVSQNCDGLHRRSGMLPDRISELHGNSNREYCKNCGKEYIRDFRAVASYAKTVHDHRTGRNCARCGGDLHDSIVNFGESLPSEPLQRAFQEAKRADLCLVLGSSLTVSPANTIPQIVGERPGGKLAICNLQKTPLDPLADLRVFSKTDDLMVRVMEKLSLPIPSFTLHRRLVVELQRKEDSRYRVSLHGVDVDGTLVTFLRAVKFNNAVARNEPFEFNFRGNVRAGMELKFELEFMGNYGEPNLEVLHTVKDEQSCKSLYLLAYDPITGQWRVNMEGDDDGGKSKPKWTEGGRRADVNRMDGDGGKLTATPEAGMNDPNFAANQP